MSMFLIHGYFLQSRHFVKPRLFSREISTVLDCNSRVHICTFLLKLQQINVIARNAGFIIKFLEKGLSGIEIIYPVINSPKIV